jgi:hypothetical protein
MLRGCIAHLAAVDDHVDGPMLQQEFAALEALRQLSRTVCSITRWPANPIRAFRFGEVDVAQHGEGWRTRRPWSDRS